MGFFNKSKKAKPEDEPTAETASSESSEFSETESSELSSGDDFDTIMADIDAVSLDGDESEAEPLPEEEKPSVSKKEKVEKTEGIPANVKLVLKILIGVFFFFLLIIALVVTWRWYNRPFPPASELTTLFFRHLSQGHDRPAWNLLSPDLQRQLKQDDFMLVIRGSSFYFRNIDVEKLELNENNFQIKGNRSYLKGNIAYTDNRGAGEFELGFVQIRGQKGKIEPRINSFKVESDVRRDIFHKDSYQTLQEFFKTFVSGDDARRSFMSFIHDELKPKRDDYGWIRLHSSLVEAGFKEHKWSFDEKFFISNVELEFRGVSQTEFAHALYGRARLFYDDRQRKWSIIGFEFSSSPLAPFQEELSEESEAGKSENKSVGN